MAYELPTEEKDFPKDKKEMKEMIETKNKTWIHDKDKYHSRARLKPYSEEIEFAGSMVWNENKQCFAVRRFKKGRKKPKKKLTGQKSPKN